MKQLFAISMILLLSACATPYQERTAAQGAVIGATAGAVIGHQSGNATEGAVIGGALGALAGAVIAEQQEQRGVRQSAPRYHRSACRDGARFFEQAHRAANLNRKIQLLRKGLRQCPNNPAAHNDLGVALMLRGDDRAARRHFNRALAIDPDYYPARRNLKRLNRGQRHQYQRRSGYDTDPGRYNDRYDDRYQDKDEREHRGHDKYEDD